MLLNNQNAEIVACIVLKKKHCFFHAEAALKILKMLLILLIAWVLPQQTNVIHHQKPGNMLFMNLII